MNLNELPKKAKSGAAAAIDRAREAAEVLRVNIAIAGQQKEIEKNCVAIGMWFVSDFEGEIPDGVKELVDAVNASQAKIAELEASKPLRTAEAAGSEDEEEKAEGKACPICGEISNTKFCPHCGSPMPVDEE